MTNPTPEAIAATLSEAEREAVVYLKSSKPYYAGGKRRGIILRRLGACGLVARIDDWPATSYSEKRNQYQPTPLGLAVRAILQGERRG